MTIDLELIDGLADEVRTLIVEERARTKEALAALRDELVGTAPPLRDCGVWKEHTTYVAGAVVSHRGTIWAAQGDRDGAPRGLLELANADQDEPLTHTSLKRENKMALMEKLAGKKPAPTLDELLEVQEQATARAQDAAEALRRADSALASALRGDDPLMDVTSLQRRKDEASQAARGADAQLTSLSTAIHRERVRLGAEKALTEIPRCLKKIHERCGTIEIEMAELHELLTSGSIAEPRDVIRDERIWRDVENLDRRLAELHTIWRRKVQPFLTRIS